MNDLFEGAEVISSYTRTQALADGVLKDASDLAREAGFSIPVALTATAWSEAVAWNPENRALQDETGRLWDVVTMAAHAARMNGQESRLKVQVLRVPNTPKAEVPRMVTLEMQITPGDTGAPVVTIGLPNED